MDDEILPKVGGLAASIGRSIVKECKAGVKHFGQPETHYQIKDIEMGLAEITGDDAFARRFFDRYIYGPRMGIY